MPEHSQGSLLPDLDQPRPVSQEALSGDRISATPAPLTTDRIEFLADAHRARGHEPRRVSMVSSSIIGYVCTCGDEWGGHLVQTEKAKR